VVRKKVVRKKIEVPKPPAVQAVKPSDQEATEPVTAEKPPKAEAKEKPPVEVAKVEPAQVKAERPTLKPEEEVSEVSKPLPSVKAESWYVLLRRMNIRQDASTSSEIIVKLNENEEFQIMEEAPANNPSTSWYLIRTRSGMSGWLCGILNGNVKYKDLSQRDLPQKEVVADLVKTPHMVCFAQEDEYSTRRLHQWQDYSQTP
jgi:uncharacterized protein YgiM (DUF1202 family)